jgi:hypothetical protein
MPVRSSLNQDFHTACAHAQKRFISLHPQGQYTESVLELAMAGG